METRSLIVVTCFSRGLYVSGGGGGGATLYRTLYVRDFNMDLPLAMLTSREWCGEVRMEQRLARERVLVFIPLTRDNNCHQYPVAFYNL